jgi:hypothetical protein
LKVLLLEWMTSVERELTERICEGCARFPEWRSPIKGSMRKSRRRNETFTATMQLDICLFTEPGCCDWPSAVSPYPDLGSGDCMLFEPSNWQQIILQNNHLQPSPFEYSDPPDETKFIPSCQAALVTHQSEGLCDVHADLGIVTSAASSPPPLPLKKYPDENPGAGHPISMATLDPRYLSITDWYSGHHNV